MLIQLSGIFLGVLSRTLLPFFRKLYQGKITSFKRRYLYQAIGSFFISLIFTCFIFPHYLAEVNPEVASEKLKMFFVAFAFGFGFNSLVNEIGAWYKRHDNQ